MKKCIVILGMLLALSIRITIISYAGNWEWDNRGWWYNNQDGTYPASSWKKIDGKWYYFNSSGYMVTGWNRISDKWYFFYKDGSMASHTWIDEYYVGWDGAWLPEHEDSETNNYSRETKDEKRKVTSENTLNGETDKTEENIKDTEDIKGKENIKIAEASTLSISDHDVISGKYDVGTTIPITGIITSNYKINLITVQLKVTYLGEKFYTKTYNVDSYSVDLSDMDLSYFDTRTLTSSGAGYCLIVTAKDASGTSRELIKDYFNMKYLNRLQYSLDDYEEIDDVVKEGTNYRVHGVISANYPIAKITVSVKSRTDGSSHGLETVTPYTNSYDLSNLEDSFDFSTLKEGRYLYSVSATVGGEIKKVIYKVFEVKKTVPDAVFKVENGGLFYVPD